jgi:hypothetical protein
MGCQPELLGQVVAQEPPVGSELARNAMVTLYVAAPGATPVDERPAGRPTPPSPPAVPSVEAEQPFAVESGLEKTEPMLRRRRKPRPVGTPAWATDDPSACRRMQGELAPMGRTEFADADPAAETPEDAEPRGEALDDGCGELPADELMVHADDVFAGRAEVSWRRVYPTRRGLTSFDNQHQRRWSR